MKKKEAQAGTRILDRFGHAGTIFATHREWAWVRMDGDIDYLYTVKIKTLERVPT